jgi:hypothetical protein
MANETIIGVGPGVGIWIAKDGRALYKGCADSQVLEKVNSWLAEKLEHPQHEEVRRWVRQKRLQIEQDRKEQEVKSNRQEVDARIAKNIRPGDLLWDHRETIREDQYRKAGIPDEDDQL